MLVHASLPNSQYTVASQVFKNVPVTSHYKKKRIISRTHYKVVIMFGSENY